MPNRAELERLLADHQARDEHEGRYVEEMRALLANTAAPFSRAQFDPGHFTASAFVLSPDRSSLMLIFHSKLQRWLQPGGHIEADDATALDAARREVAEEVGLLELTVLGRGLFDVDVHEIPARKADPSHRHFDVRFLFQSKTEHFRAGSDATAASWTKLDAVAELESDDSVLRAVAKLRTLTLGLEATN
jgi:8-oxo-dGTP pyrophosphatase MutT (NUDIX family)